MATTSTRHCRNCGDETPGPYCAECHALYVADAAAQDTGGEDVAVAEDNDEETVR